MPDWLEVSFEIEGTHATIDRIGTLNDGELLSFSASGTLSLDDYFGIGGRGHECSVSIQTAEGRVDIPVASNTVSLTNDTITLKVPAAGRAILKKITSGTRLIFAIHRPKQQQ